MCSYAKEHTYEQDYEVAMKRVRGLLELDYEAESAKVPDTPADIMWATFEAFNK